MTARPREAGEQVHVLRFSDLAHHLEEQIRGHTDPATVNRYSRAMRAGEEFPPLWVASVGGALVLADGFHRRDAAEALGLGEMPAIIVQCGSLAEARWEGFRANLRHGQPLRPKLLRPALRAFIDAGKHRAGGRLLSYREMERELPGVSHSTIRRWIEADYPKLFREMGGGERAAPGGLPDSPQPMTAEESALETARGHIAEARALLRSLPGAVRGLAVEDAERLLRELTWEDARHGDDLSAFAGREE